MTRSDLLIYCKHAYYREVRKREWKVNILTYLNNIFLPATKEGILLERFPLLCFIFLIVIQLQ
jgi:hypothetical protein